LERSEFLELGLFGVLVERFQEVFMNDEVLAAFAVVNLDIGIIGMDTKAKI
jgi:hypothetical protein